MIWAACGGSTRIAPLAGTLWRLVESQAQVATLAYVDTLAEQALLEELLETVKPPCPAGSERLHYLLKTPFRYPPLAWGSRFGRCHELGICYGGSNTATTLAEVAYYRFLFWQSMDGAPVADAIRTEHTLFSARYHTQAGVKLQSEPFTPFTDAIRHPADYTQSHLLGTAMREAGIEAFEYPSARDPLRGICVGLFTPAAFSERKPRETSQWLCEVNASEVAFKPVGRSEVVRFGVETFMYEGKLPLPASSPLSP